jgi:uncharacterized damage-inducible protein DinB
MTIHPEIALYWDFIADSVSSLIEALDGLSAEELNQKPAPNANSLAVLATHTMGNVEHNLLRVLCGAPGERDRDAEFAISVTSPAPLNAYWDDLRARITTALPTLSEDALMQNYEAGRLGTIGGRALLLRVTRHAAEHMGHAELTRDLLLAARES